jgi:hypothetical protein
VRSLTNATWIKAKGFLFLLLGLLSGELLLSERPSWKITLLLTISIWSFCRFYYFCFYVIEHYVDSNFKFSGIFAFVSYLIRTKRQGPRI